MFILHSTLNYIILVLAGVNTVFSVVTYSLKNFDFDNQQLKSDFANLPLSIFGGGIICAICAWAGGGMGLARVQKKEQCLTSFVCYMACIACCATSIWIQIHGAQGKLPHELKSLKLKSLATKSNGPSYTLLRNISISEPYTGLYFMFRGGTIFMEYTYRSFPALYCVYNKFNRFR